jgi:transposase
MMNVIALGIDIAKNVFQLHGINANGQVVLQKKLSREKLLKFIAQMPTCKIGMESCGGSNYWAKQFQALGHEVKLISPQFVKPYVKSNKNDMRDAEAICEALTRPNMRFVSIKTLEQQDIQAIHRVRSRVIKERTALVNQIRGLLAEYGIVVAQGVSHVRKGLPIIVEDLENKLTQVSKKLFNNLLCELRDKDTKVKEYDNEIKQICQRFDTCKRIMKIEGVGALTATAVVATIGDATIFKNGREMAAFIGLVPRQYSSGGKEKLLGISKRGDRYLRCLLIHGARAAVTRSKNLPDKKATWLKSVEERRGRNRATVALANKNARIMWAMMVNKSEYKQV